MKPFCINNGNLFVLCVYLLYSSYIIFLDLPYSMDSGSAVASSIANSKMSR